MTIFLITIFILVYLFIGLGVALRMDMTGPKWSTKTEAVLFYICVTLLWAVITCLELGAALGEWLDASRFDSNRR